MSRSPQPHVGKDVYIAPTAVVEGDVVLGDQVTIMHHVVIRADIAPIRIGSRVNVQDGAILHTPHGVPLEIGDDVGVGHRAVVHCRRIRRRTLIGIGAILLDDGDIGSECIIAAGTVLPPRTSIPDHSVVMGVPARIVRQTGPNDLEAIDHVVQSYLQIGRLHAAGACRNIAPPGTNPSVG